MSNTKTGVPTTTTATKKRKTNEDRIRVRTVNQPWVFRGTTTTTNTTNTSFALLIGVYFVSRKLLARETHQMD
jgi:hypothetical protein